MEVTDIKIHLREEDRLKAFATVIFDNVFVIHNMKVVNSNNGLILCMPSRRIKDGTYKDIAHPISSEFRSKLEKAVLEEYQKALALKDNSTTDNNL